MKTNIKLVMSNISKEYPGVKALDDVSFEAAGGEIIGLVGVNGAGKSTLMNVLGGVTLPDMGDIYINGEKVVISSPKVAEQHGIAFIHQELISFLTMTIADNIFISHLFKNKIIPFFINKRRAIEEAKKYLKMLGSNVSPTKKMSEIPVGERQVVEIARAVAMGSEIVIFDEPTSSLSMIEKENLFDVIFNLKNEGKIILYITHFIDEIKKITDKFVVLRNGKINGSGVTDAVSKDEIIKMIIGRNIEYIKKVERSVPVNPVLKVKDVRCGNFLKGISINLNKGEILGIWGLMGSGRTELVRAIFGLDKVDDGKIYILEKEDFKKISPKKLLNYCGYITESRHSDGLFLSQPVWKNISSTALGEYSSKLFKILNRNQEIEDTKMYIDLLNISTPGPTTKVESLSGGNQQKVVFSKWLNKKAKILVMDEPTRGVDVGAKLEIHNLIRKLSEEGTSIILISSEIEEVVILSDRVIVLQNGNVVKEITGEEINNENLMRLCLEEGICQEEDVENE